MQHKDTNLLDAITMVINPQLTADYSYYNVVRSLWPSLKNALEEAKPSLEWKLLWSVRGRLRRFFELGGYYEDGIKFARFCLEVAKKQPDTTIEQAWILTKDLGWLLILAHKYKESIKEIEKGLKLFNVLSKDGGESVDIGRFYALRYLGVAHQHLQERKRHSDFSKARGYFLKAKKAIIECPKNKQDGLKARIHNNLGNIALSEGKLDKAKKAYRESEKLSEKYGDNERLAIVQINLGRLYLRYLEHCQRYNSYNLSIQNAMAAITEEYLRNSMYISIEIGWVEGQARSRQYLALLFKYLWRTRDAISMAEESLALYNQLDQIENVEKVADLLRNLKVEDAAQSKKAQVFISMPLDPDDDALKMYYSCIKTTCAKCGLEPIRVDEEFQEMEISFRIRQLIQQSLVVIADVTYERPNVYYEIGMAHQAGKPTIITARHGTECHFNIRNLPILFYRNADHLASKLKKQILVALSLVEN